jgi:hypothetical protein
MRAPVWLPPLPLPEHALLALLALLLALNLLIWRCNKAVLTAVYDAPHLFYLQLEGAASAAPSASSSSRRALPPAA